MDLPARRCYGGRKLVEGRVGDLVRLDSRRSLDDRGQELHHFRIGSPVVGFRVLRPVPQADGEGFLAPGGDEVDLVLEALLLPEQGNDLVLEQTLELNG